MNFTCQDVLPGPSDQWWSRIHDVHALAPLIPGVNLDKQTGPNTYEGSLLLAFGPTRATFHGVAQFDYDDDARVVTIAAQGADQRGATKARLTLSVSLDGGESETGVVVGGEYDVVGPLATFAKAGGREVLVSLAQTFLQNLRASVPAPQGADESALGEASGPATVPTQAPPPQSELRVGKLIADVSRSKLSSLLQAARRTLRALFGRLRGKGQQ